MSLASKATLVLSCVVSVSIVGYVHFKQYYDRQQLHEGVIKDVERQQKRKTENIYNLQQQSELTKQLKKALAEDEKT